MTADSTTHTSYQFFFFESWQCYFRLVKTASLFEHLTCMLKTSSELSDWPVMLLTSFEACDDSEDEEYLLTAG